MSVLRASNPEEHLALKSAVKRALKIGGGAASVQHMTRVGEAELSRYGAPDCVDRHCPIDIALDLDREAQTPVILSALAELLGYKLVPIDEVGDISADLGAVLKDMAGLSREVAEFQAVVADAAADGHVTPDEHRRLGKERDDVLSVVTRMCHRLTGKIRGRA